MIDDALRNFDGKRFWKAERAQALCKKAQLLRTAGREDESAEALSEATGLYGAIVSESGRPEVEQLTLKEFDDLVPIMCR